MSENEAPKDGLSMNRRRFLKFASQGGVSLAIAPTIIIPKPRPIELISPQESHIDVKHISLINLKTGESIKKCMFWEQGQYNMDALKELSKLLRDHHSGKMHKIDPQVFDLLHTLQRKLETAEPYQLVSAYRSPETNKRLRGAAKNSYHMKGQAVDVFVQGRSLRKLCKAALSQKAGGVGLYRSFVHVDTGPVRAWGAARRIRV